MSCCCGSFRPIFDATPPAPELTPVDILGAANIVAAWDAADLDASPVALWPDASGNGFDLTQAIAASQPTWGAATGPNGQPAVLFDGVDDWLENAVLTRPAPGTEPTFIWCVLRQLTWTFNNTLWRTGDFSFYAFDSLVSPEIAQYTANEANNNGGLTLGDYRRIEEYNSNSTNDYLKIGSTLVTGTSAGDDPAGTLGWLLSEPPTGSTRIQVCIFYLLKILPSPAQLALLDAYVDNRFGPGLT